MRPDHIFFAMSALRYGSLAIALVYLSKILRYAVHTM